VAYTTAGPFLRCPRLARAGGIAGNKNDGAYSIVVSGGLYEELDQDDGEVLVYSGDQSHKNTDATKPSPSSNATLALKASQRLGTPVRVFRAAGSPSNRSTASLLPIVGIRYDGLYYVMDMRLETNANGGLYELFKLERGDDQAPLSSVVNRPTPQEVEDYHRREEGY
jgi:hypothetical protein